MSCHSNTGTSESRGQVPTAKQQRQCSGYDSSDPHLSTILYLGPYRLMRFFHLRPQPNSTAGMTGLDQRVTKIWEMTKFFKNVHPCMTYSQLMDTCAFIPELKSLMVSSPFELTHDNPLRAGTTRRRGVISLSAPVSMRNSGDTPQPVHTHAHVHHTPRTPLLESSRRLTHCDTHPHTCTNTNVHINIKTKRKQVCSILGGIRHFAPLEISTQ